MKSILFVVCGVAFLQSFVTSQPDHNSDGIVGVSQRNLTDYILKAVNGFKKVMVHGCEELDYPVMDPYELKTVSWDYADTTGSKKFNFFNTNSAIIKGLSNFYVTYIHVSAKDMRLSIGLLFTDLKMELPYKLDGYYKSLFPVFGEGLIKFSANSQYLSSVINLGTDRGYITVEDVLVSRYSYGSGIDVKVTGFMGFNEKFGSAIMNDILDPLLYQYDEVTLRKITRDLIEEAIGGMTTEEFFDLLDQFVKKNNQHE